MSKSNQTSAIRFGRAIVYTQDACLQHRNIRSGGAKNSLERPERLHAVNVGVAAVYARIEEAIIAKTSCRRATVKSRTREAPQGEEEGSTPNPPFTIVRSTASLVDIPLHPAARDVLHIKSEESEGRTQTYSETLELWCRESRQKIVSGQRELPEDCELDLYCEYMVLRSA